MTLDRSSTNLYVQQSGKRSFTLFQIMVLLFQIMVLSLLAQLMVQRKVAAAYGARDHGIEKGHGLHTVHVIMVPRKTMSQQRMVMVRFVVIRHGIWDRGVRSQVAIDHTCCRSGYM